MDTSPDDRVWKVYVHTCRENGKRYVGITSLDIGNRWRHGKGYKTQIFGNAIKKYGWDGFDHEILYDGLTAEEAQEIEMRLISEFKTTDRRCGYNQVYIHRGIQKEDV